MDKTTLIILLSLALANLAWAFFNEIRIRRLHSKLVLSEEKNVDAKIVVETHSLSDAELDALLSKDLGGSKPPA